MKSVHFVQLSRNTEDRVSMQTAWDAKILREYLEEIEKSGRQDRHWEHKYNELKKSVLMAPDSAVSVIVRHAQENVK